MTGVLKLFILKYLAESCSAEIIKLIRRKPKRMISQKVLTAQLRELELDGAVRREVFAGKRPRVEYSLTPFGERLRGLILEMHGLALQNCDVLKRRPVAGRFEK